MKWFERQPRCRLGLYLHLIGIVVGLMTGGGGVCLLLQTVDPSRYRLIGPLLFETTPGFGVLVSLALILPAILLVVPERVYLATRPLRLVAFLTAGTLASTGLVAACVGAYFSSIGSWDPYHGFDVLAKRIWVGAAVLLVCSLMLFVRAVVASKGVGSRT